MLVLNYEHPSFDMSLELLALVASEPHETPVSCVVTDLGLALQGDLMPLLENLKISGIELRHGNGEHYKGRILSIRRRDWSRARARAEAYLNAIDDECLRALIAVEG